MYNPKVLPDTEGYGPGITAAGNAISGALGTYAGWKRQDKTRAEDREERLARQEAGFTHDEAMQGAGFEHDESMFGKRLAATKEERATQREREEEQTRLANAGMAAALEGMGYDRTALEAAGRMPPKTASVFLQSAHAQAGAKIKEAMERESAAAKAQAELAIKRDYLNQPGLPIRDAEGKPRPDVGFYGATGESFRNKPREMTEREAIELAAQHGLGVQGLTLGTGLRFGAKPAAKPEMITLPSGKKISAVQDPKTGAWVPVQVQGMEATQSVWDAALGAYDKP